MRDPFYAKENDLSSVGNLVGRESAGRTASKRGSQEEKGGVGEIEETIANWSWSQTGPIQLENLAG